MPARILILLAAALLVCVSPPAVAGGLLGHVVDKIVNGHENNHGNDHPGRHKDIATEELCDNELGFLPRYTVADIEAVSQASIALVCEEMDEVNVAGLISAIDAQTVMHDMLRSHNATANDVVGIRIDADGNAILYVNEDRSLASASE